MTKDNNRIIKNSGILFFRLVLTSIMGLFSTRLILIGLGVSDFGLYNVVGGVVVMLAFLNTIMITTSYRFIAFQMGRSDSDGVNRVFNISIVIHLILAFLLILFTETVGVYYVKNYLSLESSKVQDALFVLRFSTYAMAFSIISVPYQGLITAYENFSTRAIIEIIRSLLTLIVAVIVIYYDGNKLRLYSFLLTFANLVPSLLFIAYCRYNYHNNIRWNFQREIFYYKEMLGFSSWVAIGAAAQLGKTTGSALIINAFFGTLLNAAFGIANQVNRLVLMFVHNLGQAAIPQITKSFSKGDTDRTISLVAYVSKYSFFLMLFPALPILLETDYILKLWLGVLPPYTVIFTQLIIVNAIIDTLGSGIAAAVQATGKIKYFQIVLSTTSLLSLPVSYFLFKSGYSPSAIQIAYIATALLNVIVRQFLLKRLINFDVRFFLETAYLKILYVILGIAPLFVVHDFFIESFVRFVVFSLFSVSWLVAVIVIVGIDKKERKVLSNIVIDFFNNRRIL